VRCYRQEFGGRDVPAGGFGRFANVDEDGGGGRSGGVGEDLGRWGLAGRSRGGRGEDGGGGRDVRLRRTRILWARLVWAVSWCLRMSMMWRRLQATRGMGEWGGSSIVAAGATLVGFVGRAVERRRRRERFGGGRPGLKESGGMRGRVWMPLRA